MAETVTTTCDQCGVVVTANWIKLFRVVNSSVTPSLDFCSAAHLKQYFIANF